MTDQPPRLLNTTTGKCGSRLRPKWSPTPRSQTGRGSTLERSWIAESFVPLRPSRPGGFTPSFHGQSTLHVHWVKQLRRLQSLAQMYHSDHIPTSSWIERRLGQWRSITRAAGFKPSFAQWWAAKAKHLTGLPTIYSRYHRRMLAGRLATDFQQDLHGLEQMLARQRLLQAKQNRKDNPARIFQDLNAPRPEPVQMLLAHTIATIEAVDAEECAVVLDLANAFEPDYNGIPLSIVHHDTDKIWLATWPSPQEGDRPTQSLPVTDIHAAFQDEWMARWDRHASAPDSRWAPIVAPSLFFPSHPRRRIVPSLMKCGSMQFAKRRSKQP